MVNLPEIHQQQPRMMPKHQCRCGVLFRSVQAIKRFKNRVVDAKRSIFGTGFPSFSSHHPFEAQAAVVNDQHDVDDNMLVNSMGDYDFMEFEDVSWLDDLEEEQPATLSPSPAVTLIQAEITLKNNLPQNYNQDIQVTTACQQRLKRRCEDEDFVGIRCRKTESGRIWVAEKRLTTKTNGPKAGKVWLGSFFTREEAARAYDAGEMFCSKAARSFNFPESPSILTLYKDVINQLPIPQKKKKIQMIAKPYGETGSVNPSPLLVFETMKLSIPGRQRGRSISPSLKVSSHRTKIQSTSYPSFKRSPQSR